MPLFGFCQGLYFKTIKSLSEIRNATRWPKTALKQIILFTINTEKNFAVLNKNKFNKVYYI